MFDRLTGAVADASQSRDGLKVPPSPQSVHQPPLLSSMSQVASASQHGLTMIPIAYQTHDPNYRGYAR